MLKEEEKGKGHAAVARKGVAVTREKKYNRKAGYSSPNKQKGGGGRSGWHEPALWKKKRTKKKEH